MLCHALLQIGRRSIYAFPYRLLRSLPPCFLSSHRICDRLDQFLFRPLSHHILSNVLTLNRGLYKWALHLLCNRLPSRVRAVLCHVLLQIGKRSIYAFPYRLLCSLPICFLSTHRICDRLERFLFRLLSHHILNNVSTLNRAVCKWALHLLCNRHSNRVRAVLCHVLLQIGRRSRYASPYRLLCSLPTCFLSTHRICDRLECHFQIQALCHPCALRIRTNRNTLQDLRNLQE